MLVVVDAELPDIEQPGALVGYLKETGRVGEGEEPVVRVLAGGVSNRTVLVERPEAGEARGLQSALPQLGVAAVSGSVPGPTPTGARGLGWVAATAPPKTLTPPVF